jgi:hypothetical protein
MDILYRYPKVTSPPISVKKFVSTSIGMGVLGEVIGIYLVHNPKEELVWNLGQAFSFQIMDFVLLTMPIPSLHRRFLCGMELDGIIMVFIIVELQLC